MKNNQGKIFQIGMLTGVITLVLSGLEGWLASGLYASSDPALWKDMSGNWWVYNLVFNLLVGLILTLVYSVFYKALPDSGAIRGLQYGFWIWIIGVVPGLLMTLLSIAVPEELVVVWLISGLFNYLISGLVIGAMYQPQE